ncbi:MAG TPA: hypothetical protein VIX82_02255 [Solirubrobacteraceae bacterium]
MRTTRKVAAALALVIGLVLAPTGAVASPVPHGFVGVVVGTPLFPNSDPNIYLDGQLYTMVMSGVQSIRVAVDWSQVQPYKDMSQVPQDQRYLFVQSGGIPTNFSLIDQMVAEAARRQVTLMPMIIDAPRWDALKHTTGGVVSIPRSDGPYARFLAALVRRYGPHGTFWQNNTPKLPVRMWQVWNEPNLRPFWPQQPWVQRYVGLLKAAHDAIKRVDPGARVILGGLPNYSWRSLQRIYAIRGARRLFDVVAVHPYTKTPAGVITILSLVRQVMNQSGDPRKPIVADEVSWPSSLGKTVHNTGYDFATTEAGQARNLSQLLPLLGRYRTSLHLMGFYWYTWASNERRNGLAFDFSGLLRYTPSDFQFTPKPALQAFTKASLALEGCQPNLTAC